MKDDYYNGEVLDLWFEDGILIGIYKAENVTLPIGQLATKERLTFTNNKSFPVLTDYSRVRSTTKEARDYFVTDQASKNIKAMALLINSMVGKVVFNFFISINKPPFPMQIFNDKEKAIEWLQQFK